MAMHRSTVRRHGDLRLITEAPSGVVRPRYLPLWPATWGTETTDGDGSALVPHADHLEIEIGSGLANDGEADFPGAWHVIGDLDQVIPDLHEKWWGLSFRFLLLIEELPADLWVAIGYGQNGIDGNPLAQWVVENDGGTLKTWVRYTAAPGGALSSSTKVELLPEAEGILGIHGHYRQVSATAVHGRGIGAYQVGSDGMPLDLAGVAGPELSNQLANWLLADDPRISIIAGRSDDAASGTIKVRPYVWADYARLPRGH